MNSRPTHSTDHERARKSCLITHRCASETLLVVIFRGTVIFGFEQANQYTILNEAGDTVALLAEDLGGFGKQIGRQLLRTRRPFTATVFSPDGALLYPPACTCLLAVISAACCWARDIASSGCNVWVQISRGAVAAVLTQQWLHCAVGVGKCSWQLCMLASAAEHCTCLLRSCACVTNHHNSRMYILRAAALLPSVACCTTTSLKPACRTSLKLLPLLA